MMTKGGTIGAAFCFGTHNARSNRASLFDYYTGYKVIKMVATDERIQVNEDYWRWRNYNIRYWESLPDNADADLPAVVMIHGYAAMVEHYRRTFAGLTRQGTHRLYGLDLLGFGLSDKPGGNDVDYSAGLWARQVSDFLEAKGETRAILIGHSLGGMVVMEVARRYPQKAAALVLIDSAGLPDQGDAEREAANRQRKRGALDLDFGEIMYKSIQLPGVGEAFAMLLTNENMARRGLQNAYWKPERVTPQLVRQFVAPLRTPGARDSYLAITRGFAKFQLPLKPGDLSLPVLILWGEHDRSMPPRTMLPRFQRLFPQAETQIIPDTAHCPQDERPDLVNARLAEFFTKVGRG